MICNIGKIPLIIDGMPWIKTESPRILIRTLASCLDFIFCGDVVLMPNDPKLNRGRKDGKNEIRLKQFRLFLDLFQPGFVRLCQNFLPTAKINAAAPSAVLALLSLVAPSRVRFRPLVGATESIHDRTVTGSQTAE